MSALAPILTTIADHRQTWDAFQVAPEGEEAENAECAMRDAMDALVSAACAFPILSAPLPDDARALLAHLRWWLAEEAEFSAGYQPGYAILKGRTADLARMLEPADAPESDPIIAAIVAADMASAAHTATLTFRDEDDEADMVQSETAGRAVDRAFEAVQQTVPTTLAGLLTLVRFYARDARIYCRWDTGGEYLEHVATALAVFVAQTPDAGAVR